MADVTVDATISTATARGARTLVFPSELIGYVFYLDSDGILGYSKTTDGGATWGAQVDVDSAAATTTVAFDIWFDKWTPGDTGTLIHIWWFDVTNDITRYRSLNITGDVLGTQRNVFTESSAVAGRGAFISGTKARSGYLYVAYDIDAGAERGFRRSIDAGATWSATNLSTSFVEATLDTCKLFPASGTGDDNDCWALYYDASALALTLKLWDSSAATAIESATIGVAHTDGATDLTGQYGYDGAVRFTDGHLIVVALSGRDVAASQHQVFDCASTSVITTLTAIAASTDDHYYPQVFINQGTGTIFVAYNGKRDGSEVLDTTTKAYYTYSLNGGTTWNAGDAAYQEGAAGVVQQVWTPMSGSRFYVVWRVGTTLLGNKVNSLIQLGSQLPTIPAGAVVTAPTVIGSDQAIAGATIPAGGRVLDAFTGSGALAPDWTSTALSATATVVRVSGEATASAVDAAQITSAYVSSLAFPADQYAQVTITAVPGGESNHFCNLLVRASGSDTTFDGYLGGTNGNRIFLAKLIHNRTWTPLVDFPVHPGGVAVGDILRLEAEGTTLRLKQNGTTIASTTDSTLTTGAPGIGFLETASILARSDDFEAGPLAPRVFPPTVSVVAPPGDGPIVVQDVYRAGFQGFNAADSGTLDATPTVGHLLWAVIFIGDGATGRVVTPPSGWTALPAAYNSGDTYTVAVYYKIAGSSEPLVYTWTWTNNSFIQYVYLAEWTGTDPTTPIDVQATAWTDLGIAIGTIDVPAITTVTDGAVDLVIAGHAASGAGFTLSGGYTTELDDQPFGIFSKAITPAGTTGVRTVSVPGGVQYTAGYSFALRPAPAAGPSDQAVIADTIGPGSTLFVPEVASGAVPVLGASIGTTAQLFAPSLQAVAWGATIASGSGTFAPSLAATVITATRSSTAQLFAVTVAAPTGTAVSGATLGSSLLLFGPTISPGAVAIGGATRASTVILSPPTVSVAVLVGTGTPFMWLV